jgi:DNA invertase Pin-like site-specific DNA recombinase
VHLLERSQKRGWQLVALDMGIDTSTAYGEAMANMAVTFAQLERRLIGERIKVALALKRDEGVRLGRPPALDPRMRKRIRGLRTRGHSYGAIAERLSADVVPTAHRGARWHAGTVQAALGEGGRGKPRGPRATPAEPARISRAAM